MGGLEGEGGTARESVDHMVDNFATGTGRRLDAEPLAVGHSGAATQTWLALKDGSPALTIAVTCTADHFEALPDALSG